MFIIRNGEVEPEILEMPWCASHKIIPMTARCRSLARDNVVAG